ncbi:MAG TPA: adenylate/guanylate cyclase domain-containing protein [Candidatus Cybelea sp.]|nr:adenylate/guanylate cyclase domain-containing protein [Candidatus Cybelea sp.]
MKSPALPTGTVVFLFSDIEGSTRRWDTDSAAMQAALRRHDEILRFEIERRRGYVFKTIGDAFCAAFWTIEEALEAAVDIQRQLGRANFGAVEGLAVRMAIHAGETDERAGDYFGPAVNRTARLLAAGHGGQILISGFTAELAMRKLPVGIALRHLGTLPLRDLKDPEEVYQPIAPDLRSDFKPLRGLETAPNNLPRQTTSFVGRRDDVARIDALLTRAPLVTIVGAGGVGKTRVALEVAANRLDDHADGVWFVDLSAITSPSLIAGTILSGLGAEPTSDLEPLETLRAFLQKRELLLLLDNSEHLVSDVAGIVAQIVARCAHVSILATSRAPLDITSERIYRLATLDVASAVELFVDRARAAKPDFRAEQKISVVEAICRRLDGIALAIELAAARVRSMPVEDLASHLELRLLAGGRDRRPRQQTMRALLDWSYDLLTAQEQAVLRRCAVFARGFTLEVALSVCSVDGGNESRTLGVLTSLADRSLVTIEASETPRYRLLEPIREYASEKLDDAGEMPETARRHARAFASLAHAAYEEWETGPRPDWLSRLEGELSNFRTALLWSAGEANDPEKGAGIVADLTPVFLRLALLTEGIEWCERVLEAGVRLPGAVEARLRYGLSMLYSNIGANKKVLEQAENAAALYRASGDSRGLSHALSQVASRYAEQSRNDEATAAAEEALRLARELGDRRLVADTLRRCASTFAGDGVERVRTLYAESVALFRSLGRDDETARALEWWGQWEAEIGNFGAAAEHMLEAKRFDSRDVATMFWASEVASCYLALGDPARAEPFALEALVAAAKARHPVIVPMAISYVAIISSGSDPNRAARLAGYAEERLRAADWQRVAYEQALFAQFYDSLKRNLGDDELERLFREGSAWSDEHAVAQALSG